MLMKKYQYWTRLIGDFGLDTNVSIGRKFETLYEFYRLLEAKFRRQIFAVKSFKSVVDNFPVPPEFCIAY